MRASPLPRSTGEVKMEQSSGSCSKSLFTEGSNSKITPRGGDQEVEVEQTLAEALAEAAWKVAMAGKAQKEVESVAESLGNVAISGEKLPPFDLGSLTKKKPGPKTGKRWARKPGPRKSKKQETMVVELGKRQLVDAHAIEADPMELDNGERKRRNKGEGTSLQSEKVVLDDQHRLAQ